MHWTRVLAVTCLAVGIAATTWSASELQGGIVELPSHWWSSASALILALGAAAVLVAWRAPRPASRRSR
jgi:hypothetical protein